MCALSHRRYLLYELQIHDDKDHGGDDADAESNTEGAEGSAVATAVDHEAEEAEEEKQQVMRSSVGKSIKSKGKIKMRRVSEPSKHNRRQKYHWHVL